MSCKKIKKYVHGSKVFQCRPIIVCQCVKQNRVNQPLELALNAANAKLSTGRTSVCSDKGLVRTCSGVVRFTQINCKVVARFSQVYCEMHKDTMKCVAIAVEAGRHICNYLRPSIF